VIHGDCLEKMKDIPDKSIDFVLTDIPYNISKKNNFKTMKDRTGRNGTDFGEWDKDWDITTLTCILPKVANNGGILLFHSIQQLSDITNVFSDVMEYKDTIIWEKSNPMPRNRDRRYVSNVEMASWFVRKNAKWVFNRQSETYDSCVYRYPSESGGGFIRYHPCQKNLKLLESLVLRHTNTGDTILDPFMGSGSTGVACINTNRNFIGIEKDDKYFEIAKKRIADAIKDSETKLF